MVAYDYVLSTWDVGESEIQGQPGLCETVAQRVKVLVTYPHNLILIGETNLKVGENEFYPQNCPLISTHRSWQKRTHTRTLTHTCAHTHTF